MKKSFREKIKRGLAGFLAFSLVFTSFSMDALAGVEKALEKEEAVFVMNGQELFASAQAAN